MSRTEPERTSLGARPAPVPASTTAPRAASASARGASAWPQTCVHHPRRAAWSWCRGCGEALCGGCRYLDPEDLTAYCEACAGGLAREAMLHEGALVKQQREEEEEAAKRSGELEPRSLLGHLRALPRVLFRPTAFFSQMQRDKGVLRALLFGALWSCLGVLGALAMSAALTGQEHALLEVLREKATPAGLSRSTMVLMLMVELPCVALLQIGLFGVALHGLMYLMGARGQRLLAGLKVVGYALAGQVWLLIPSPELGFMVARVFTVALLIIGLRVVYESNFLRAAVAVAVAVTVAGMLLVGPGFDVLMMPGAGEGVVE